MLKNADTCVAITQNVSAREYKSISTRYTEEPLASVYSMQYIACMFYTHDNDKLIISSLIQLIYNNYAK